MVDERAALAEADRLGIEANDEEIRQRIMSIPAFQENGAFIGDQRYQQLLRMQRMTAPEFESNVRRQLIIEKLRASVTDWLAVPDTELEQEYRRRNDKVKLAVVSITADTFRSQVTATDDEVASYFSAHPGRLQDSREAQDQLPARGHRGDPFKNSRPRRGHRACLQQQHRTVFDARSRCERATSCSRPKARTMRP